MIIREIDPLESQLHQRKELMDQVFAHVLVESCGRVVCEEPRRDGADVSFITTGHSVQAIPVTLVGAGTSDVTLQNVLTCRRQVVGNTSSDRSDIAVC